MKKLATILVLSLLTLSVLAQNKAQAQTYDSKIDQLNDKIEKIGESMDGTLLENRELKIERDSLQNILSDYDVKESFFNSTLAQQTGIFSLIITIVIIAFGYYNTTEFKKKLKETETRIKKENDDLKSKLRIFEDRFINMQAQYYLTDANCCVIIARNSYKRSEYAKSTLFFIKASFSNCKNLKNKRSIKDSSIKSNLKGAFESVSLIDDKMDIKILQNAQGVLKDFLSKMILLDDIEIQGYAIKLLQLLTPIWNREQNDEKTGSNASGAPNHNYKINPIPF